VASVATTGRPLLKAIQTPTRQETLGARMYAGVAATPILTNRDLPCFEANRPRYEDARRRARRPMPRWIPTGPTPCDDQSLRGRVAVQSHQMKWWIGPTVQLNTRA
jgi:hypothetical protein